MVCVKPVEQAEFTYKILVNLAPYLVMQSILTVIPVGGSLCNLSVGLYLFLVWMLSVTVIKNSSTVAPWAGILEVAGDQESP